MISLNEALSSCAFTVADPELPDLLAFVSGDYVTFGWLTTTRTEFEPMMVELDQSGPVQHSMGNSHPGGIHGADAAELYDQVRAMLWEWATAPESDEEE